MIEDYSKHAAVWDWDGYDNTSEYEYWCKYAGQFGENVLIPMCALGQTGAYMAQHGFNVVAFDITKEMIEAGKKRFGSVSGLELLIADIRDFSFTSQPFDFVFLKDQDLHLLTTINDVKRALISINKHMRKSGCLILELALPAKESSYSPKRVFHPRKPNYPDKKVWKESECRYDAATGRNYIDQVVFIEDANGLEHFNYSLCLQYFDREEVLNALEECGFSVKNEYCSREKELWKPEDGSWIVEAEKR